MGEKNGTVIGQKLAERNAVNLMFFKFHIINYFNLNQFLFINVNHIKMHKHVLILEGKI